MGVAGVPVRVWSAVWVGGWACVECVEFGECGDYGGCEECGKGSGEGLGVLRVGSCVYLCVCESMCAMM